MTPRCAIKRCETPPLYLDDALCADHEAVAAAAPEVEVVECVECHGRGWNACRCARDGDPGFVYNDGPRDPGDPEWIRCTKCGPYHTGEFVGRVRCEGCGGTGKVET